MEKITFSLIIPVYLNEDCIEFLIPEIVKLNKSLNNELEIVFVVDGSPDKSYEIIENLTKSSSLKTKLVSHSRNFGSFIAVINGLKNASGKYVGVISADLQEPPMLMEKFFKKLTKNEDDIVLGKRLNRADENLFSKLYWNLYKKFINKDIPVGGLDIFACNENFKNELVKLDESNTSLVGLIMWLGFRRSYIEYNREERIAGKSSWTIRKKFKYFFDSIFAFSDLPIRCLIYVGTIGILISLILGSIIFFFKLIGLISVPGYTALAIILLFFVGLNSFGLGIIGSYVWRTYENTKKRPNGVVMSIRKFNYE